MDFTFTEEQEMLRDLARKFTDKEIRPLARQIDEQGDIPKELIKKMAELGFFGIAFPEEYGGVGGGEIGYCIVLEEISRGCGSTAVMLGAHQSIGAMAIYLDGTEEQKKKYLTPLARGEKIAAFALTEPGAGSDAAAIETSAVLEGDHYVLNGQKIFITNGSIADIITVFAVTDKALGARGGVTAFIVEATMPGYKVVRSEDKMGIRGTHTSELLFENVRVPKENVLGRVGYGFLTAMKTLDVGRLSLAAGCVGAAKELLDLSTRYATTRVQFGKPIAEQQAIQWMLAEMAADIFAMESLTYRAAWMRDAGLKFSREAAIAKFYCSEALDRIVDKAVQIHGGMGYMKDYPIERMYRDARINRIFEGTNEIQRMVVARDVIKKGGY
ncbi:MAG: acyl-CoA dehydrogenase family protein [candidate division KSB1 bacterium]|nr:acyl-CoA dehydrogenase family protein [candidate division KSB1 bacterium]